MPRRLSSNRRRLSLKLLFGLCVLVLGACADNELTWSTVKQKIRSDFPGVEQLSTEALRERLASGERPPVLLDVREDAEYSISHLRGAVRVDPGDLTPSVLTDLDKDTPIVTYCSVGYRSSRLAHQLQQQGYTHVSNLEGSIFEWANKGYPVFRGEEVVREVHPYNRKWGRLLVESKRSDTPRP